MTIDAVALSNSGKIRPDGCIIDGEAVACDDNGVASFDRIRYRRHDGDAFLYAFDLIELNGNDMRREPLEVRKATLRSLLARAGLGLRFNKHMEGDGPTVFACMSSEHFGQLARQFERMSGSSGLKVQAAIAC